MPLTIFVHGLESSNKGTKSLFFRKKCPDMVIPNFSGSLKNRMEKLEEVLSGESGIRLVGSSFGGLMSCIFGMVNEPRVDRLVLLAPAINLIRFSNYPAKKISVPVWVYHGSNDEVIPLNAVKSVAEEYFSNLNFHTVNDDHSLHDTFRTMDWAALLG